MSYRILFVSVLVFMIMSCSKDSQDNDAEISVSGTFADINTIRVMPAELYTQSGRITNSEKITFFVNRKGLNNSFFVDGSTTLLTDMDLSLSVNDDHHTAEIKTFTPGLSFHAVISDYKNGQFIITGTDSLTSLIGSANTPLGSNPNPYSLTTCGTTLNIGLLEPPRNCQLIAASAMGAYTQRCQYLPVAAVEVEDAGTLFIPTLSYYFTHSEAGQRCTFSLYNSWNVLNPEFYKQLSANDTVLVQKKQIILKKGT